MGPKRRKAVPTASTSQRPPRSTRSQAPKEDEVPDIYREMLAEAEQNPVPMPPQKEPAEQAVAASSSSSTKRRKLDHGMAPAPAQSRTAQESQSPEGVPEKASTDARELEFSQKLQTIFDDDFGGSDDASTDENENEDEFEDVDLEGRDAPLKMDDGLFPSQPLEIDLGVGMMGQGARSTVQRRKPATPAERKMRLDVHKWHLLCLLTHLQRRSHWCDDMRVQSCLKPLVPVKYKKLLHLDASESQFQRSHSFRVAIEYISKIWLGEWRTTESGLRRAFWKDEEVDLENLDDLSDPMDMDDFREAARRRTGSRDIGAQLFCALLRSVAVETRLVSSLQPLPFSGVAKGPGPEKPKPQYALIYGSTSQNRAEDTPRKDPYSNPRSRLYSPEPSRQSPAPEQKKKFEDSPYPIFWVEAFDAANQKWLSVDSLVRKTLNKPKTGFEPPANDSLNSMSYVMAFEDDGSAVDVTRRYVTAFNGKTRRNRVESTRGGQQWWRRTMAYFEKPFREDRDDIESAELVAREANEPMPKNIQDFKHHPQFALERHLRRNEVIHPRREVGKVLVGSTKLPKLEPVFRRADVLALKTADQWYRVGRDVRRGEQPLKRAILRRRRALSVDGAEQDVEEGALLYAAHQTELHVPPPTVERRVPRNVYGNLDIYVQSMIPAGAIHVQHPDAARASRVLGIDYVDAVTGFKFSGRQGTAVVDGVVAAIEYRDSLVAVIEGIEYERALENALKRADVALQMWRRFLLALRIVERTQAQYGEDDEQRGKGPAEESQRDGMDLQSSDDEGGGGFLPEAGSSPVSTPQATNNTFDENNLVLSDAAPHLDIPIVVRESLHRMADEQPQFDTNLARLRLAVDSHHSGGDAIMRDEEDTVPPAADDEVLHRDTTGENTIARASNGDHAVEGADTGGPAGGDPTESLDTNIFANSPSSSSSLSKGSLMSHDPEDSDAEPEWIVDLLGAG